MVEIGQRLTDGAIVGVAGVFVVVVVAVAFVLGGGKGEDLIQVEQRPTIFAKYCGHRCCLFVVVSVGVGFVRFWLRFCWGGGMGGSCFG